MPCGFSKVTPVTSLQPSVWYVGAANTHSDRANQEKRVVPVFRLKRLGFLAVLVICGAFLLTACGDSAKPGQGPASAGSQEPGPLGFAACVRTNGVPNFPDPNSDGQFVLTQNNGSRLLNGVAVDLDSPKFEAAYEACQSLLPPSSNAQGEDQMADALVKFAACMRQNGVPNFPDPNQQGGKVLMGSGGLDPNAPEFQQALQSCRDELSGLTGGAAQ